MPPFRYTPNQNSYVGSIADLMGRGNEAEARALIASANAQAQAAQASGQAWGGAVQGIGNIVSQGITDWNSPAARRQREMDKAAGIARDGAKDRRIAQEEAIINRRPQEPVPTRSMLESATAGLNLFDPTQQASISTGESFDSAPPGNLEGLARSVGSSSNFAKATLGQQAPHEVYSDTIMQPLADRGYEGDKGMRAKLDETGQPVMRGRYTQDNGQYDSDALLRDLIAAGIPLDVANQFAAQGVQANTIIAAGADISKQYRESQLAIQGEVAGMALRAIEIGVSPEEAVRQANPGGDVLPEDQVRQFEVMFHRKTPEEQIQILREIHHRASFLGELTAAPRGTNLYNERGDLVGQGQSTATAPTLGSKADMFLSWFGPTPTVEQKESGLREWTRLNELPVLGLDDIRASHLNLRDVGARQIPGDANAGATGSNGGTGSGGRSTDYLNPSQDPDLGTTGNGLRGDSQAPPPIGVNPPPAVSDVPEGAPTESSTQGLVPQEHSTFQTFPNFEAGRQAQRDLWLTDPYQNRTVRAAIARWTGGPGKADDGYVNALLESVGAGVGDRPTPMREKMMSDVTPDELEKLLDAQQKWEGWNPGLMHGPIPEPGSQASIPSLSFNLNNPGNIKRTDNGASAGNVQPPQTEDGSLLPVAQDPMAPQPRIQAQDVAPPAAVQPRAESRPGEYTRDSPQAYVMRHAGPTPTDAERRKLEAEYQLFQRSAIAAEVDPSAGPSFDPLANELGIRPNSDGVYNLTPMSPVMTPNLGDTVDNSMGLAMMGMNAVERQSTLDQYRRYVNQRQPAHVMKHLIYTAGVQGLGVDEGNQVKGRYATSLALRGVVSILNEMKEEGVHTGWLTGNYENLHNMLGKTSDPRLASLSTRLADMVIAYRRAATGVQFGVTEKQDYENMMPGIKFEENLNFARIGGLQAAMDDHLRSFWEQKIGAHNSPVMFPEFYPSEPNDADFTPGEVRMLQDGTQWIMGKNGEAPRELPLPPIKGGVEESRWFGTFDMINNFLEALEGPADPGSPPPKTFWQS